MRRRPARRWFLFLLLGVMLVGAPSAWAAIERVSVSSAETQADGDSGRPSVSADGSIVAFDSVATNLATDTNGTHRDIFKRHRSPLGRTFLVSVDSAGQQGSGDSWGPALSGDGRIVAFLSTAPLHPDADDICYYRDGVAHLTYPAGAAMPFTYISSAAPQIDADTRAAVSRDGRVVAFCNWYRAYDWDPGPGLWVAAEEGGCWGALDTQTHNAVRSGLDAGYMVSLSNGRSLLLGPFQRIVGSITRDPLRLIDLATGDVRALGGDSFAVISDDGRTVVFRDNWDLYAVDLATSAVTLVSRSSAGVAGNRIDEFPSISADGRFVAFQSNSDNLVPGNYQGQYNVFVHDRQTGETTRVSVDTGGGSPEGDSYSPSISADGRVVAFQSSAYDIVPDDTNDAEDVFAATRVPLQPDLTIKRLPSDTSHVGDDVYNTTGAKQTKARRVLQGTKATYLFGLWNDDWATRSFRLRGPAAASGWTVKYFVQGQGEQTSAFTGDGYTVVDLAPWRAVYGWCDVTALPTDGAGAQQTVLVTATSVADASKVDAVKAVTTRRNLGPDLQIRTPSETVYTGDNVYSRNGTNQTKARTKPPGVKAVYHWALQNDDKQARSFTLTGPAASPGWTVRYYLQHQGEQTAAFTGAGYTVTGLAPGASVYGWVNVTPLASEGSPTQDVLVTAVSKLDAAKKDSVRMTTTRSGAAGSPALAGLTAVPTRAGAQVSFTLAAAADVEARVLNMAGRPVRTLCQGRDCAAGANTLLWNATSDAGLRVPSGAYLVEVVARTPDGSQARAVTTVRLSR